MPLLNFFFHLFFYMNLNHSSTSAIVICLHAHFHALTLSIMSEVKNEQEVALLEWFSSTHSVG